MITMLAAFVFSRLQADPLSMKDAILTGLEMNLRAVVLITGFSVLGTELYHPAIRAKLARSYFRQLPPALGIALESLPSMIAMIPDMKTIMKNPVIIIHGMLVHAEHKIERIQHKQSGKAEVIVITGPVGSGKTTLIKGIVTSLKKTNVSMGGFYSNRILENGITTGYMLTDISSGSENLLLTIHDHPGDEKIGKFNIVQTGFLRGKQILENKHFSLIIIDEVGKLELQGKGWADSLGDLIQTPGIRLLLSVRQEVLEEVLARWNIETVMVYDVSARKDKDPVSAMLKYLT